MDEQKQFRFTPDIQQKFKKTLNELKDKELINKLKLMINYLTAIEEQLKMMEELGDKQYIDPEIILQLKHNLTLGHNEAIHITNLKKQDLGTTHANPQNPEIVSPELQKNDKATRGGGPLRASVDQKYIKHYINEYKRVDITMLSTLDTLMKVVEKIYQQHTIDDNTEIDLTYYTMSAFDVLRDLIDQEQQYLLTTHDGIFPHSIYFIIKQLILDTVGYITAKNNYLREHQLEIDIKVRLRDWFVIWKQGLVDENKATNDDFAPQGKYAEIQQLLNE